MKPLNTLIVASLALAPGSLTASVCKPTHPELTHLVNFGDSASDEGRIAYMIVNTFTLPPAGTFLPPFNETATGGLVWPRIVAQKTSATSLNYATLAQPAQLPSSSLPLRVCQKANLFLLSWKYNSPRSLQTWSSKEIYIDPPAAHPQIPSMHYG
ncbi:hypothetical protein BDV12DRAFT_174698 [Aspergillus spectabilis]